MGISKEFVFSCTGAGLSGRIHHGMLDLVLAPLSCLQSKSAHVYTLLGVKYSCAEDLVWFRKVVPPLRCL